MRAVRTRSVVRIVVRTTASIAVRARRIVATSSRNHARHNRRAPRVVPKVARSLRHALRPAHRHQVPAQSVRRRRLSPRKQRIVRNVQKELRVAVAGVVAGVGVAQAGPRKEAVRVRKAR
jgi:hypothetical protein